VCFFYVCACINIHGYLCVSVYAATRLRVFSHVCVCVCLLYVCQCLCVCVCVVEKPHFYSHINIDEPSLYSTPLPENTPQPPLFPVRPRRSYSWQKKNIRWAGQRIIEVMIGAVQRQLIVMETAGRTRMWNNTSSKVLLFDNNSNFVFCKLIKLYSAFQANKMLFFLFCFIFFFNNKIQGFLFAIFA